MDTMLATGNPYLASISFCAVVTPPLPTSMRLRETIRPLTSTLAAFMSLGYVSSMDLPDVVTSSTITTRSPSLSS